MGNIVSAYIELVAVASTMRSRVSVEFSRTNMHVEQYCSTSYCSQHIFSEVLYVKNVKTELTFDLAEGPNAQGFFKPVAPNDQRRFFVHDCSCPPLLPAPIGPTASQQLFPDYTHTHT